MKTYKEIFYEKLHDSYGCDEKSVEIALNFMLDEISKDNDRIMEILKRKE